MLSVIKNIMMMFLGKIIDYIIDYIFVDMIEYFIPFLG